MGGLMLMQTAAGGAAPVTWDVPADCPSEAVLRGEVRRLLGGAEPDLSGVRVDGRIDAAASGFDLRLVVETPDGSTERRLRAPSCEPLVDSAALYVAMAVDAVATVTTTQEPPPTPEPAPVQVEPPPEPPRSLAFDLRASGGVSVAAYGRPGGLGSLYGSLLLGGVRLELGGTFTGWAPIPLRERGPSAAVLAVGTELRACPSFRRDSVELFGCAGAGLGLHRARGLSVDRALVARSLSVDAVVATGMAWWPTKRLGLWFEPAMVLGLYRPRFVVDGAPGTATAGAVSARVSLGVLVRLWEGQRG